MMTVHQYSVKQHVLLPEHHTGEKKSVLQDLLSPPRCPSARLGITFSPNGGNSWLHFSLSQYLPV